MPIKLAILPRLNLRRMKWNSVGSQVDAVLAQTNACVDGFDCLAWGTCCSSIEVVESGEEQQSDAAGGYPSGTFFFVPIVQPCSC